MVYKYDLVWEKEAANKFLQLKRNFGKSTEMILYFIKNQPHTILNFMSIQENLFLNNIFKKEVKNQICCCCKYENGKNLTFIEYHDNGKDIQRMF